MSAYATKLAEGFSLKLSKEMYAAALFDQLVNRDYEGDIVNVGSVLNILDFSRLSEKDYSGSNLSVDDLNENNGQLTIDKQKSFYYRIKSIDQFKSYIKNPQSTIVQQTAEERRKNIDTYVFGKYGKTAAGQRIGTDYTAGTVTVTTGTGAVVGSGTTFTAAMVGRGFKAAGHTKWYRVATFTDTTHITIENDLDDVASTYDGGSISGGSSYTIEAVTPIQMTTTNALQLLLQLKQKLDAAEVPANDRVLILPTEAGTVIPRGTNINMAVPAVYDSLIKTGWLTDLAGFRIFMSARLSGDNTNGYHALGVQRQWQTFADKVIKAQMEEDLIGNFGSAFKDLFVYGSKVKDNRRKFGAELFMYV